MPAILKKSVRSFFILFAIFLAPAAITARFLQQNKISADGHAPSFILFLLLCMGATLLFTIALWFAFLFFWSLFDLMRSEFTNNTNKVLWFLALLFLPVIGTAFYIFISPEQKTVAQS